MQMTGQRDGNEVWMVLRFEPDSGGGGGGGGGGGDGSEIWR